jgi:hypothetical protein
MHVAGFDHGVNTFRSAPTRMKRLMIRPVETEHGVAQPLGLKQGPLTQAAAYTNHSVVNSAVSPLLLSKVVAALRADRALEEPLRHAALRVMLLRVAPPEAALGDPDKRP